MKSIKAVSRVSCLVFRENLKDRVADEGSSRLVLPALSRTSPRHVMRNAGQDSNLAALMLNRPGREKKTEGLQYQKTAKGRDSCFVKTLPGRDS